MKQAEQGSTPAWLRDPLFAKSRTLVRAAEENWRGDAAAARARFRPDADVRAAVNRMSARGDQQASRVRDRPQISAPAFATRGPAAYQWRIGAGRRTKQPRCALDTGR